MLLYQHAATKIPILTTSRKIKVRLRSNFAGIHHEKIIFTSVTSHFIE